MQALIMSALAMATLMKSSELELGSGGRALALTLRSRAESSLEQACKAQSLDSMSAAAALVGRLDFRCGTV